MFDQESLTIIADVSNNGAKSHNTAPVTKVKTLGPIPFVIERGLNPRQPIITTQVSTLYSEFLTKYYTYSFGIEFPLMFLIAFMKISMFQVLQTNQFCPTHSREEIITKLEKQDLRKCGFKFPALCVLKDLPFTPRIRYSIIFLRREIFHLIAFTR